MIAKDSPVPNGTLDATKVVIFLAVALGVVMPVVEAVIYPTYFIMVEGHWYERTRLIELPYVLFEIAFILWARSNGFDPDKSVRSLPRDIHIAGAIWLVVMMFGAIFVSSDINYALTHSFMWIVHVFFALAVFAVMIEGKLGGFDRFMHWHTLGLVVLAIYTAWWFARVPPAETLPFGRIELQGALPGWISVRHFGSWTGAIAAGFAIRILWGQGGRNLTLSRAGYFVAAGLTVWSGTRAAILAVVVVTILFLFFLRKWPTFSRIGWATILTLLATAAAYLCLPDDPNFYLIEAGDLESGENFTATRTLIWSGSIDVWLRSPWIGLGTGSIFWEFSPTYTPTQPHNVVLQFLISWGLIGTLPALWMLLRAVSHVHRSARPLPQTLALQAMLYALLFQSLLEGMLHYPRFIISSAVLATIIVAASRQNYRAVEGSP